MADAGENNNNKNAWHTTADLLVSDLSSKEAASSAQAVRRLFDSWEAQLLETLRRKQPGPSVAALVCQRELLTRFYRIRQEFDADSPIPNALPIQIPANPRFDLDEEENPEGCPARLGTLPEQWLGNLSRKFAVLEYHRQEVTALFTRFFDQAAIRRAADAQIKDLSSIAEILGTDSAIKALCNDSLRKTLAPLAANRTLDADSFREMLAQDRHNYDGLTIDGGGDRFSLAACSFRATRFRNITLQLKTCALHGIKLDKSATLAEIHDCEFGQVVRKLRVERLRGDYSSTGFADSEISIVFPGTRIDHLSNCRIGEFGGQAKRVEKCRIQTLRGLLFQVSETIIDRAIRARFGPVIHDLRCSEVTDCQFGARVIEGVRSINRYTGTTCSQSTFVDTAFGSIEEHSNLFRLRQCRVKHLKGHVGTLEHCRITELHAGAIVNKVIRSQLDHIAGGHLKLCGTHEEDQQQAEGDPPITHVRHMSAGRVDHLNGRLDRLTGGSVGRVGFEKTVRLRMLKQYIPKWLGGSVTGMTKKAFLDREKQALRDETKQVAAAIRKRASLEGKQRKQQSRTTENGPASRAGGKVNDGKRRRAAVKVEPPGDA